jgi:hypothetical protein
MTHDGVTLTMDTKKVTKVINESKIRYEFALIRKRGVQLVRSLTLVFTDDEYRAFDVIHYNEGKIEVVLFSSSYKVKRNHQGDLDHVHDKRPQKKSMS